MSPIFLDQACKTSPLQRRQCQKKNQNHQGVPQPCLERDPQNVRHKICSKVKVQRPHHWPPDLNFYLTFGFVYRHDADQKFLSSLMESSNPSNFT